MVFQETPSEIIVPPEHSPIVRFFWCCFLPEVTSSAGPCLPTLAK